MQVKESVLKSEGPADSRLKREIDSFDGIWRGGYYEGDPLDPMAKSTYRELGFMSVLHLTYLACIKPYINAETVACEIGPGRGAWTKCMLEAKEIWCLDALSAKHNGFWEYVGHAPQAKYFQVEDFSCKMLPENAFNYLFSFGCLCHVSFEGITAYMTNLFSKLKPGAQCFILVADYEKLNRAVDNMEKLSLVRLLPPKLRPLGRLGLSLLYKTVKKGYKLGKLPLDEDKVPSPGRWYHAGTDRTCAMLTKLSYRVIQPDMNLNYRDPVIHFTKD